MFYFMQAFFKCRVATNIHHSLLKYIFNLFDTESRREILNSKF